MASYFDMNSYSNNGGPINMQLALVPAVPNRSGDLNGIGKENIRVAVRVRPLLPNEAQREEVVYYSTYEEGPL